MVGVEFFVVEDVDVDGVEQKARRDVRHRVYGVSPTTVLYVTHMHTLPVNCMSIPHTLPPLRPLDTASTPTTVSHPASPLAPTSRALLLSHPIPRTPALFPSLPSTAAHRQIKARATLTSDASASPPGTQIPQHRPQVCVCYVGQSPRMEGVACPYLIDSSTTHSLAFAASQYLLRAVALPLRRRPPRLHPIQLRLTPRPTQNTAHSTQHATRKDQILNTAPNDPLRPALPLAHN
ncbi:hypothetical protein CCMSSC00406_0007391 [Pleurotus cornucopiae]|uniref:Uncharacterized protein n=1 Tax=Pleurotus cornucopiae TaxID=5321 RepID=A0ACB7ISH4_PLECO|nr:hypothetical protein CCMSSC00406_0007391 [Pleurotus cornucopiae]